MSTESVLALGVATFVLGVTPGPGVLALLARSLALGARSGVPFMIGLAAGDLIYLACAMLGLAVIANEFSEWFVVVKVVGGAYLIYLGLRLLLRKGELGGGKVTAERGALGAFASGVTVTLGNPKVIVFYLAFLPTFLDLSALGPVDAVLAATVVLSALLLAMSLYVLAAGRARLLLRSRRAVRNINRGAGAVLTGAGVAVVVS